MHGAHHECWMAVKKLLMHWNNFPYAGVSLSEHLTFKRVGKCGISLVS